MLKQVLTFTLLLSSFSMAQVSKTQVRPTKVDSPYFASEGIRVGIFKPNYELKVKSKLKSPTGSVSETGTLDIENQSVGLSAGYSFIPVRNIGYVVNANLIELVLLDNSVNTVRVDGSGTYAFNKNFYSKAGLNYTRFVSANAGDYDGDFGFQVGIGAQITTNLGFDLNYSHSNFKFEESENTATFTNNYSVQGIEMGLSATF